LRLPRLQKSNRYEAHSTDASFANVIGATRQLQAIARATSAAKLVAGKANSKQQIGKQHLVNYESLTILHGP
jgi:hypothetical protein